MDPVGQLAQEREVRHFPLLAWRVDLFLVFRVHVKHSSWDDSASVIYPHYLALQQVGFLPCEVWIHYNSFLEIACEQILQFPGCHKLSR